jgi:hypothetical protein
MSLNNYNKLMQEWVLKWINILNGLKKAKKKHNLI